MSVKIRLKRFGRKKKPTYRVVVANNESPRDGATLDTVGTYNPLLDPVLFEVKKDRIEYWLSVGAIPTRPVERLLSKIGLLPEKKVTSQMQGVAKKKRDEVREAEAQARKEKAEAKKAEAAKLESGEDAGQAEAQSESPADATEDQAEAVTEEKSVETEAKPS